MRILAFSDLHRDEEAARRLVSASEAADVVVGAGDFATKGLGLADMLDILAAIARPLVLVAGNHERLDDLRQAAAHRPDWHVLHGETATIAGKPFFGVGFEVAERPGALPESCIGEAEAGALLTACPDGAVLVTHHPPHGVADIRRDGLHHGSRAIRAAIEAKAPRLHLCGHIHHSWGLIGQIGGTGIHNLGPAGLLFDLPESGEAPRPLTLP